MTLFDEILAGMHGQHPNIELLDSAVMVDINNVNSYINGLGKRDWDYTKDFPALLPAWEQVWFEYRSVFTERPGASSAVYGWRVVTVKAEENFIIHVVQYVKFNDRPLMQLLSFAFKVNKEGAVVDVSKPTPNERVFTDEQLKNLTDGEALASVLSDFVPVALAISFANCKNVAVIDHPVPPKVARKRIKNNKPPGVTFKTLAIEPMKQVLRTEGQVEKVGLKKALHICRGHFATYGPDKKLFGKHTGTFWVPMHTKGNKKYGEVKKDYKVNAPPESP